MITLLWANGLYATIVTVQDAENVGVSFFKINVPTAPSTLSTTLIYTQTEPSGAADFYVFGITPGKGFVIVAADDAIEPVIGYSSESNFDLTPVNNIGLKDWMKSSAAKISGAVQQHIVADANISNLWTSYRHSINPYVGRASSVAPLMTTTWNQEPYYNAACPGSGSSQAVTGCVATAMAQIMKFWNYPTTGQGSFSYSDQVANGYQENYGTLSANFGNTTYNWAGMPNSISAANTSIATLMYQCGISVAMDYSPSGSAAWVLQSEAGTGNPCAQKSYVSYFKYASSIQGVKYASYTSSAWITLLENELNAGRPLQYQGTDPGAGGHTWVCDGYNSSNQMHMNWGWGGVDNGYFSVSNLSVGGYTFSSDDAALIGIQPPSTTASCGVPSGLASSAITTTGATVSWTAVSGATSYNLQYKTSSASVWTTVSVATTSKALTGLTASTTYDYQVAAVCANGTSAYSASSTFATSAPPLTYCASNGNSEHYEWISLVKLHSINYTGSAVSGGYINTGLSGNLQIGSSNDTIYFSPGFSSTTYKEYWAVYIDYNKNGVFTDGGEEVVYGSTTGSGTFYAVFSVPSSITAGAARMRVIMSNSAISSPCGSFNRGEVEDFTVNLSTTSNSASRGGFVSLTPLSEGDADPSDDVISLYPNPAQTTITINTFSDNTGTAAISVFNLTGQKLISEERENAIGTNAHEINVSSLPAGIYVMEIASNGTVNRRKFTIAK